MLQLVFVQLSSYLNEYLQDQTRSLLMHDSEIARISKMTIKALISMSKTCKFLVKETYIHVKKEQGLPFEVLGKLLEIIYFSSLQFGNFSSISFSSAVRLLS